MNLTPTQKKRLDTDMRNIVKNFQKFWKAGRMSEAAQCAHDLERMALNPKDWLAQFPLDSVPK